MPAPFLTSWSTSRRNLPARLPFHFHLPTTAALPLFCRERNGFTVLHLACLTAASYASFLRFAAPSLQIRCICCSATAALLRFPHLVRCQRCLCVRRCLTHLCLRLLTSASPYHYCQVPAPARTSAVSHFLPVRLCDSAAVLFCTLLCRFCRTTTAVAPPLPRLSIFCPLFIAIACLEGPFHFGSGHLLSAIVSGLSAMNISSYSCFHACHAPRRRGALAQHLCCVYAAICRRASSSLTTTCCTICVALCAFFAASASPASRRVLSVYAASDFLRCCLRALLRHLFMPPFCLHLRACTPLSSPHSGFCTRIFSCLPHLITACFPQVHFWRPLYLSVTAFHSASIRLFGDLSVPFLLCTIFWRNISAPLFTFSAAPAVLYLCPHCHLLVSPLSLLFCHPHMLVSHLSSCLILFLFYLHRVCLIILFSASFHTDCRLPSAGFPLCADGCYLHLFTCLRLLRLFVHLRTLCVAISSVVLLFTLRCICTTTLPLVFCCVRISVSLPEGVLPYNEHLPLVA